MCAYFYVQIYQAKKFTQAIEKLKYERSGAFQSHYIGQNKNALKEQFYWQNEGGIMLQIKDVEEKKMIVAYYMARNRKNVGLENVWRIWSAWWKKDFSAKGRALTMYDHTLVLSKTKAREKVKAGENYQDFKEYDDFLAELCKWLKENYDNTVGRKTNAKLLKEQLLKHRSICDQNIRKRLKNSGLRAEGYKLQNQTSKKHPLLLGRYLIIGTEGCVKQGSYEEIMNYIDEMEECK